MQMLIEYGPKASGLSFLRFDCNPSHADMERIEAFLCQVLPGGLDDLPLKAKVTRFDLSVDVTGVHIDSLLAAFPGMQVSRGYYKSGKTEALYLGGYEGARHVVMYDKVAEVIHLNAKRKENKPLPPDPTTRIEIRLRPDVGPVQLTAIENPFLKLIVSSLASVPTPDDQMWKLFVAVSQFRGAQDALLMIEDKNMRTKFRERIKVGNPSWWQAEKLWENWHPLLHETFMLNSCSKQHQLS